MREIGDLPSRGDIKELRRHASYRVTVTETDDLRSYSDRPATCRVIVTQTGDLPSDSDRDRRLTE